MIGILDWELCTLGSPLADLGNLLLPFSIKPITESPADGRGASSLLVGLKGLPGSESGLPLNEELEQWWVQGMNDGARWHAQRQQGGTHPKVAQWAWPIQDMA